ncbi:MAG TPA: hypothetical protein VGD76_13865, partial [Ramlibacter sp.]
MGKVGSTTGGEAVPAGDSIPPSPAAAEGRVTATVAGSGSDSHNQPAPAAARTTRAAKAGPKDRLDRRVRAGAAGGSPKVGSLRASIIRQMLRACARNLNTRRRIR